MRLFTAVTFSPEAIERLVAVQREVARHALKGTWAAPDSMHLTLAFLGEVDEARIPQLSKLLAGIHVERATLELRDVGRFVSRKRKGSHVVRESTWWIAPAKCPELLDLQARMAQALTGAGFELPERVYHPHVTLGRRIILAGGDKQTRRIDPDDLLAQAGLAKRPAGVTLERLDWPGPVARPIEAPLDSYALVSSTLTSDGPVYREVERFA